MKILAIVGSCRKNGNTDQLVDMVRKGLNEEAERAAVALEVETLHLADRPIGFCRGCRACFDRGEESCPVKDDLLSIKAKMKQADGILVASPVYVHDVSGVMKNWIDRLAHVCHRPEFAGKCGYLLVTVGGSPTRHALGSLHVALSTWGFFVAGATGLKTGGLMTADEARRFEGRAQRIAGQLFRAIHKRRYAQPSFRTLMTFKIQQCYWQRAPRRDTLDYTYWKGQGWLEPGRDYYAAHKAWRPKVIMARLAGAFIAPFVS